MSPDPARSRRIRDASGAWIERMDGVIGVLTGDAFRIHMLRAFIEIADEIATQHGREESQRVMGVVVSGLRRAMDEAIEA